MRKDFDKPANEVVIIEYSVKIGLELHIPLTEVETKLFCRCRNPFKYPPHEPNQYICPTCLGLPGSLPKPNKSAVAAAIKLAKALNMEIPDKIQFYRKHYLYPDLPKGYQITQYPAGGDMPIGVDGWISFQGRRIVIRRIQLEEDPARLDHPGGLGDSQKTLIDYNRSGAPLIEMVTDPEFTTPKEARRFIEEVKTLLEAIGILSGDASIKVDANVSLEGGPRIEIKNISSARDVERALEYEILRLSKAYSEGLEVYRETRHWDSRRRITIPLRTKEYEEEYRYIPDPNLPPIDVSTLKEDVSSPTTPQNIFQELKGLGVRESYAYILSRDPRLHHVYSRYMAAANEEDPDFIAGILINICKTYLEENGYSTEAINVVESLLRLLSTNIITIEELKKKLRRGGEVALRRASKEEILDAVGKAIAEVDIEKRRARDYVVGKAIDILREKGLYADPKEVAEKVSISSRIEETKGEIQEEKIKGVYGSDFRPYNGPLNKYVGEEVEVSGWIEARTVVGKKLFIRLRRWGDTIQVVASHDTDVFNTLTKIPREAYIVIKGMVKEDERAPNNVELYAREAYIVGESYKPPLTLLDLARSSLPVRMRYRYLDLRRRRVRSVLYVRSELLEIIRNFLRGRGFIEINTPTIITSATEGGAELFPLIFYGREAFLAQSPQLYKQMAINAFEKVFELDSYYRAQKFDTPRHLAEFWSLDVEAAFYTLDDLLVLIRDMLGEVHRELPSRAGEHLERLNISLAKPSFKTITYREALEIANSAGLKVVYGEDIPSQAETEVYRHVGATYLFITEWPETTRAFYYRAVDGVTRSFDLIGPFKNASIELASGGERMNSEDELKQSIRRRGLREEAYTWYLEMFRYGMPPHGGFGMGIDRLVASLLGLDSVLEATFLPRTPRYHTP